MKVVLMKVVCDENSFDEIDHFHPNFDESAPNQPHNESRCSKNKIISPQRETSGTKKSL